MSVTITNIYLDHIMKSIIYIFYSIIIVQLSYAETVNYELKIAETILSPAGEKIKALTINGCIPGPVLKFKVGDLAHIKVQNELESEVCCLAFPVSQIAHK